MQKETHKGTATFYAKSKAAWRSWLQENHAGSSAVWLIIYRKESKIPSVYYNEAVDEALCFGWIDSTPNKRNDESYYQFFAKRNPKSNWSKVNKDKVGKLIKEGRMTTAGLVAIETAKQNGTWDALNKVDEIVLPDDLKKLFDTNKTAFANWEQFARSSRRGILEWIHNAKRPETRQKRIEETVALAEKNLKANHYRQ